MARKRPSDQQELAGDAKNASESSAGFRITPEHRKAIDAVVLNSERLKMDKEALSEDIKGVAAKIGCKPADVNQMVAIVIQERNKGGAIEARERSLDLARQVLDVEGDGETA